MPAPPVADREGLVQGLGARAREDRRPAGLHDGFAGGLVDDVQPDPPELADVAEAELPAVVEGDHQADVRIQRSHRDGTTKSWPVILRWIVRIAPPLSSTTSCLPRRRRQ